jgi:4-amino-4-deoxy-L-arabinose transferase-like glycosyltransferase
MRIKKINNNKTLIFFLFAHVIVWTLVPSISNTNLPLDTIEALAWGGNLDWGYSKHPPFSAWSVEIFYRIFGNQDWAYYFLSQLFVITAFFVIFKFSEDFFKNKILSLISVLLLEGIYFYNFTTPEFNVNVCQLPFWSLTVYYCWKGIKQNDITSWLLFGLFAAFGILSKYLFVYLLVAIDIFFIYLLKKRKFNSKCLISLISFFVILTPHFVWLADSNYVTFSYAFKRTGLEQVQFLDHIYNPIIFLGKQFGILIPFFLMFLFAVSKLKPKINFKDKKFLFLLIINVVPILLMFLTSLLTGTKLRTMWMTPFYLFMGVFFVYIFQKTFVLHRLKYFFSIFLILFIFFPTTYFYISITQDDKRTDYPGKKISQVVQAKWDDNFSNKIGVVGGNEWHAGNLSYHLKSRPKWDNIFATAKVTSPENNEDGFVLIGEEDILLEICNGTFFKTKGQGICMIGMKK